MAAIETEAKKYAIFIVILPCWFTCIIQEKQRKWQEQPDVFLGMTAMTFFKK